MAPDYGDYGQSIAEAFQTYLKTGDKSHIDRFSSKELRTAISRLSPYYDNNKHWYRALEKRIQELSSEEQSERKKTALAWGRWKDRWLGKIVAFILGFVLAVFVI